MYKYIPDIITLSKLMRNFIQIIYFVHILSFRAIKTLGLELNNLMKRRQLSPSVNQRKLYYANMALRIITNNIFMSSCLQA